jgi:outer membrane biosynthesis protein TonB
MSYHDTFHDAQADRAGRLRSFAVAGAVAMGLAVTGVGVWQLVKGAGAPKRKQVQQISLVQPKELPKPPPEPEKPKEELKEKIETPPPEAKNDSPPPEAPVRLEGAAGPGGTLDLGGGGKGSEFNIARPSGDGDGRRGHAFYTNHVQAQLQDELNRKDKLRGAEYSASVALWIGADGRVQKVELAGSTGNPETDALLRETIAGSTRLKSPPESMPQPVRLRVTARGSG